MEIPARFADWIPPDFADINGILQNVLNGTAIPIIAFGSFNFC